MGTAWSCMGVYVGRVSFSFVPNIGLQLGRLIGLRFTELLKNVAGPFLLLGLHGHGNLHF